MPAEVARRSLSAMLEIAATIAKMASSHPGELHLTAPLC
jgi:hypothetical protein